jgi:beta-galactosidase
VGGTLISEGCPAYFGDGGRAGVIQPNYALDELFGARQSWVEFTPDLLGDLRLTVGGLPAWGGIFMQAYQPTTGTAVGWYADGQVAAVEHTSGRGRTLLLGTMTGAGHAAHAAAAQPPISAPFFASLLEWAGVQPALHCSDARLITRLTTAGERAFLWVANPTRQEIPAQVELSPARGLYSTARTLWGARAFCFRRTVGVTAPARDVTILALEP